MTQTYLIPQYLYDYVYPFTLDSKFHQITYNKNFPSQGQRWLDSVGFDRKYLFYAIKKGHKQLPATCEVCGKPLKLDQIKNNKMTGKYCSNHCSNNSDQAKFKRAQTDLQRYGTTNPNELDIIKQRKLKTINRKYGSQENLFRIQHEHYKQTCMQRYGVDNVNRLDSIKQKKKQTCLKHWGVEYSVTHPDVRNDVLSHQIVREKYWPTFLQKLAKKNIELLSSKQQYIDAIATNNRLKYHCLTCGCEWETNETNPKQLYCPQCVQANKSTCESAIKSIINDLLPDEQVVFNSRRIIKPLELDAYVPNKNLAIEYNGTYYHRTEKLGNEYHQNKSLKCLTKGIRLIHIFDWEYNLHFCQVLNAIKNALNIHKHIVNDVSLQTITHDQFNDFLIQYCTDILTTATTYYGVYSESILIAVLGFNDDQCVKIVANSDYQVNFESIFKQLNWPTIFTNINEIDINYLTNIGYKVDAFQLNSPYYANAFIDKTMQKPKQSAFTISDAGLVRLIHK